MTGTKPKPQKPQEMEVKVDPELSPKHLPPNSTRFVSIFAVISWILNGILGVFISGTDSKESVKPDTLIKGIPVSRSPVNGIIHYINHSILLVIFFVISIYKNYLYVYRRIRLKGYNLWYYPNKSPSIIRNDVNKLSKIPKRLSCILDFKDEDDENGGIDGLINDISELVAWSISAGILELNVYEYNGVINDNYLQLNYYINKNLKKYFGTEYIPNVNVKIPHRNKSFVNNSNKPIDLTLNLLSKIDGKQTILELTKTMSELAVNKELTVNDITVDLINEELVELVGPEPDLLVAFTPSLDLQDYPPWHIRLTELYWEPDNKDVTYAVFIRALQSYAKSKVNVGK